MVRDVVRSWRECEVVDRDWRLNELGEPAVPARATGCRATTPGCTALDLFFEGVLAHERASDAT